MIEKRILIHKRSELGKKVRKAYEKHQTDFGWGEMKVWEPRNDEISNTISTVTKDNLVLYTMAKEKSKEDNYLPEELKGKKFRIRKLTPRECFRLMDVDESKIDLLLAKDDLGNQKISNSQLYKCAGNSIVVSCMEYMFRNLFYGAPENELKNNPQQVELW